MPDFDLIIIGAGPAGLIAAIKAAENGNKVVVCERQKNVGVKLLASGGGRCNITNSTPVRQFANAFGISKSSLVYSCLKKFGPNDLKRFFAEHGVTLVETDGLFYPSTNRAGDILEALLKSCGEKNVEIRTGLHVEEILHEGNRFTGIRHNEGIITGRACIIAAGGKSYPKLGGSESGYILAKGTGHQIVKPVPGLVALITKERWPGECAGITLDWAKITIAGTCDKSLANKTQGGLLFTHRGISGPAALDISASVARILLERQSVTLKCILQKETDGAVWLRRFENWQQKEGGKTISVHLSRYLSSRLANAVIIQSGFNPQTRAADISRAMKVKLVNELTTGVSLTVTDTEGWDRAMVTSGGVSLEEIDHDTLESKHIKGLYFAGEVLDSCGPCGGFNLTWCFSSGAVAADGSN